jgi:hypothetical protein
MKKFLENVGKNNLYLLALLGWLSVWIRDMSGLADGSWLNMFSFLLSTVVLASLVVRKNRHEGCQTE